MTIPARLHFCWIGAALPWAYVFAVLTAAERSQLPEIVLHHTEPLDDTDAVRALAADPRVRLSHLEPDSYLCRAGRRLGVGDALAALYRFLPEPVMRADLLRAALLYAEGGIYLDLDTITVTSLQPLTAHDQFVGSERIVWPRFATASRLRWCGQLGLDVLRRAGRRAPGGWRAFRLVERLYFRRVNNAVMGAAAQSPFFATYLRAMLDLPPERQTGRYALGPHLLQDLVAAGRGGRVTVLAPRTFYPLPPEISEHWFRATSRPVPADVLSAETLVVHWYASVRTRALVAQINPAYIARNRSRQLYSALVSTCLGPGVQAG